MHIPHRFNKFYNLIIVYEWNVSLIHAFFILRIAICEPLYHSSPVMVLNDRTFFFPTAYAMRSAIANKIPLSI